MHVPTINTLYRFQCENNIEKEGFVREFFTEIMIYSRNASYECIYRTNLSFAYEKKLKSKTVLLKDSAVNARGIVIPR